MGASEERACSPLLCIRRCCVGFIVVLILLVAGAPGSASDAPSARSEALSKALQSAVFIEVGRVYHDEEIWTTGSGFFITEAATS